MATKQLTPRQREVKDLLDKGKTPVEVADALGMSENNVYQHIRRMGESKKKGAARKRTTKRTRAPASRSRRSTSPRRARPSTPPGNSSSATTAQVVTPLQAVRHRRQEIEEQLAESAKLLIGAEKAHRDQKERHGTLVAKREDELRQLAQAEEALTGKKAAKRNGSGSKSRARRAAATATVTPPTEAPPLAQAPPPQAPPEPVEPPTGDEALTVVGAEQERPGAETLPEFSQQGEDAFDEAPSEGQLVGEES